MSAGGAPDPDKSPSIPSRPLNPKPSWISRPPLAKSTTTATMKQEVRISYRSKGLRPPVYIATSLSQPEWEPMELHSTVLEDKELEFWRSYEADEGEYQYKFRLGPGDWWALDENKPIVDDGKGNRNNVIHVDAPQSKSLPSAPSSTRSSIELDRSNALQISNASTATTSSEKPQQVRLGPAEPLTPPMTPEMSEKLAIDAGKFQPFPSAAEIQRPASAASHYSDRSMEEAIVPVPAAKDEKFVTHDEVAKSELGMLARFKYMLITLGTWMINMFGGGMRATGLVALAVGLAAVVYKVRDVRDAAFPGIFSVLYPSSFRRNATDPSSMV